MPVFYKCKICGEKHPSPVAYTKESLDSSTISGQIFKCPKTGQAARYDLIDLFWEDKDRNKL